MMALLDKLKNVAGNAVSAGVDKIRSAAIPINLMNNVLNQAARNVFNGNDEIKSLTIAMHPGWFEAKAHIQHNLAECVATVAFEITRFEVAKQVQVIQLRQIGKLETAAEGWRNQIVVNVVKTLVSSFLGRNLLHWGLKDQDGISFSGDLITVDLDQIGAKDALFTAMAEKMGERAGFMLPLIEGGAEKLADFVSINGAECVEDALKINITLPSD